MAGNKKLFQKMCVLRRGNFINWLLTFSNLNLAINHYERWKLHWFLMATITKKFHIFHSWLIHKFHKCLWYYKTKGFYHFDLHFVTWRKNAVGLVSFSHTEFPIFDFLCFSHNHVMKYKLKRLNFFQANLNLVFSNFWNFSW